MRTIALSMLALTSCVVGSSSSSTAERPNTAVTVTDAVLPLSTLVDDAVPDGYPTLTLTNAGADTAIVGVESTISSGGGLNITLVGDDWIERKAVESLPSGAGGTHPIQHRATESRLRNVTAPLAAGDTFELTMHFDDATVLTVPVAVAP